jgi:hypothetical protein
MVRNNESWELGDPEMNDRGQPVIHDIASKLGCIRPSPDLPYAFPEGADDFAELQAQLQSARSELGSEDTGSRKPSEDSPSFTALDRTDRAKQQVARRMVSTVPLSVAEPSLSRFWGRPRLAGAAGSADPGLIGGYPRR